MPNKAINITLVDSGSEHYIDLPVDSLDVCKAAISKQFNKQSLIIIDETGIPLLNDDLLRATKSNTFYIVEKDPNSDTKITNPKAVGAFHKASVKFLKYVEKDAIEMYSQLSNKIAQSSESITKAIEQRAKNLESISELKHFNELFNDDVEQLKVRNDSTLKAIKGTYITDITRILSEFSKAIKVYSDNVNVRM